MAVLLDLKDSFLGIKRGWRPIQRGDVSQGTLRRFGGGMLQEAHLAD